MPSFDIVVRFDEQEVDNAVNQAQKEITQRYDFKGSKSSVEWDKKEEITILGDDDYKLNTVVDILKAKLAKRGVSVKNLKFGKVEPATGGTVRQVVTIQNGIPTDTAKAVVKMIKDTKIKVQSQIREDEVRVTGKKRDDLQEIMGLVREKSDLDYQFVNFRD